MSNIIFESAADTAKKIRARLKKEFPELKASHFSVRSSTFSGGSSVRVSWEDYPTYEDVRKITDEYNSGSFDGMRDMYEHTGYKDPEDGKLYSGAKYIQLDCEITEERRSKALNAYLGKRGDVEHLRITKGMEEYKTILVVLKQEVDSGEGTKVTMSAGRRIQQGEFLRNEELHEVEGVLRKRLNELGKKETTDIEDIEQEKELSKALKYINGIGIEYREIYRGREFKEELESMDENNNFKGEDSKREIKNEINKDKKDEKNKEVTKEDVNIKMDKSKAVEKLYGSKETLAMEVLKGLLQGKVNLIFIKADGTERFMEATRSLKHVEGDGKTKQSLVELNTETEIKKEIGKGTISVIDLGKQAPRKFVLDRLKYFQVGEGEVVGVKWEEKTVNEDDLKKYFDPTKIKTEKMIDILNKKVVRLVFEKSDGSTRPMIATRDNKLIELYMKATEGITRKPIKTKDESAEAIQRQIDRDYVNVFDLTEGEFRTFKPSKLKRYDDDLNISSWIEFTPSNDAWYDIAIHGSDPVQYFQEGKRGAVNIGSTLPERKQYEDTKREYIEDAERSRKTLEDRERYAAQARQEAEIKVRRRNIVKGLVNTEAKEYISKATEKDKKVYKELVTVPDTLSNNVAFNNMDNEITQVKNFDKLLVVAIQVRQDVLYLHPKFIVNAYSGRVYLDNTDNKIFSDIGEVFSSDVDWGSEDVLEPLAKKISSLTGTRKKKMFKEDEGTRVRLERILTLAEQNKQAFKGYGMNLTVQDSPGGETKMLSVGYKNERYLIHPDIVIKVEDGKGKVVHRVVRSTSRGAEFGDFFKGLIRTYENEQDKKVMTQLRNLVLHGLDLRKTVKKAS